MILSTCRLFVAAVLAASLSSGAFAKYEQWTDAEGKTFKGEALTVFGPFALFAVGGYSTRSIPLHALSQADCLRLYEALRDKPPRAADWAQATSTLSREVFDFAQRGAERGFVKADLAGQPEPELFLLVFGYHDHSESWDAISNIRPVYERLRQKHPGVFEAIYLGVQHDEAKNTRQALETRMPWLVTTRRDQARMKLAIRFTPKEPPAVVIVTRQGYLVQSSGLPVLKSVDQTMASFENMLDLMRPDNPKTARDRLNYLRAVQPVAHRDDRCDPVLLATPFYKEALEKLGVKRLEAVLRVGADGKVQSVNLKNDDGAFSPGVFQALTEALKLAPFVAAVDHGQFVEGDYTYRLEL